MKKNGFSLIEMLIALSIFGMLTAAGVTLMTVTARTQETSDRLLEKVGELRRTGSLLQADLALAVPRLHRGRDGRPRPAFAGGGGDSAELLVFVRGGWDAGEGPRLQRVGYRLREGRLERLAFAHVDGSGEAVSMSLLHGVRALRLRYRDEDGQWQRSWAHSDPSRLPRAVELVADSEVHGLVRMVFAIGNESR